MTGAVPDIVNQSAKTGSQAGSYELRLCHGASVVVLTLWGAGTGCMRAESSALCLQVLCLKERSDERTIVVP